MEETEQVVIIQCIHMYMYSTGQPEVALHRASMYHIPRK